MALLIMPVLLFAGTANISSVVFGQVNIYNIFPFFPTALLFFISLLAETIDYHLIYQKPNLN